MIITTTIPEAVRLRPVLFFNEYVKNGDLANTLYSPFHSLICNFSQEELPMAITITNTRYIQLEINHSLLDDLPIDLQGKFDGKNYSLLVLTGLFLDCVITNGSSIITFYEGKLVSKETQSNGSNKTLLKGQLDETIIPNPFFKPDVLADTLKILSCFFPSHKYSLKCVEGENLQYFNTFHSPDGLLELLKYKLDYRLPIYFFHHGKQWFRWGFPYDTVQFATIIDDVLNIKLSILVAPFNNMDTHVLSYSQYELKSMEGSHIDILKRHLKSVKNKRAGKNRQGYTCLVSFEGSNEHLTYSDSMLDRIEGPVIDALMQQAIEQLDLW